MASGGRGEQISDAELKWHSLSVVEWGGRQCGSLQRVAQQKPNPNKQKLLHFHTMRLGNGFCYFIKPISISHVLPIREQAVTKRELAALRHYYEKQQQHLMFVISWEEQTNLLFDIGTTFLHQMGRFKWTTGFPRVLRIWSSRFQNRVGMCGIWGSIFQDMVIYWTSMSEHWLCHPLQNTVLHCSENRRRDLSHCIKMGDARPYIQSWGQRAFPH
ncbi:hypothetical protein T4B_11328 [Trichinella pseudospiralis]|uniref:Uncharacterized protein n=1 Tax=Trichinella pseudospiralis TaxID=6337 RepID=A0A0V1IAW6_TRIPS|nr:hypothetical protein T4B_11328 [Trichinella pseudospiralis]